MSTHNQTVTGGRSLVFTLFNDTLRNSAYITSSKWVVDSKGCWRLRMSSIFKALSWCLLQGLRKTMKTQLVQPVTRSRSEQGRLKMHIRSIRSNLRIWPQIWMCLRFLLFWDVTQRWLVSHLPTFRDSLLVPSPWVKQSWPTTSSDRLSRNVGN
jgi:hypothetical protein